MLHIGEKSSIFCIDNRPDLSHAARISVSVISGAIVIRLGGRTVCRHKTLSGSRYLTFLTPDRLKENVGVSPTVDGKYMVSNMSRADFDKPHITSRGAIIIVGYSIPNPSSACVTEHVIDGVKTMYVDVRNMHASTHVRSGVFVMEIRDGVIRHVTKSKVLARNNCDYRFDSVTTTEDGLPRFIFRK